MKTYSKRKNMLRKQIGSSMVEVIVAIVITAIGLLGVAGLQINALRYQKQQVSVQLQCNPHMT